MTLQQLAGIIRTADQNTITQQLKALDYIDCKKDKKLRNLSIETLFKSDIQYTETFSDKNGKRTYEGGIFTQVKGYEQLEFIIVNINDNKNTFPIDLLIWAKEIEK